MICKFCGKETSDTAKFCTNCGADLSDTNTPQNTGAEQTPPVQPSQLTAEYSSEDNSSPILNGSSDYSNTSYQMPQGYAVPDPNQQPKKKSKAGKIILIIAAIVVVFVIIFVTVFAVVFKSLKGTYDSLGNTWEKIDVADSSAIIEDLPDEYLQTISDTYSFSEDDVASALDLMLSDLASSQFSTDDVKISSFKTNHLKKGDATDSMTDVINSIFENSLADYEDQFTTVFAGTYAFIDEGDKFYSVDETVKDSSDQTSDYKTIIIKNGKESYDVIPLLITDICCYYYSVYMDYMSSYGTTDESVTENE